MDLSIKNRQPTLDALQNNEFDVLIIGGGITGAGLALQAAASGLETGLIEMQDFSEGTSSRSTKLVHGGLRYLKNFDVEVVSDTVTERAVVQQIAPHIPKATPMLIPLYDEEGSTFDPFRLKVAMDLYDSLAGVTGTTHANFELSKEEVIKRLPGIQTEGLLGGGNYLDYSNSDVRLVIENIKQAHEDGAIVASRVKATGYTFDDEDRINGVEVEDVLTGETFTIKARTVVNASGPWSDKVRNLSTDPNEEVHQMRPTKGVHLVIDDSVLKVPQPIYFDTGLNDGRMVFVIPREGKTYFGTTDKDYNGDLKEPTVTQEDVDYLLDVVNRRFPKADITLEQVESSWAGLRPLIAGNSSSDYNGGDSGKIQEDSFNKLIEVVKRYLDEEASREDVEKTVGNLEGSLSEQSLDPSEVSRGSQLDVDDNGLITIAGGKITDYRKMAEGALKKTVEILRDDFNRPFRLINSKTYPVSGGKFDPENVDKELELLVRQGVQNGFVQRDAEYLTHLYGSNVIKIYNLAKDIEEDDRLEKRHLYSLHYALRHEAIATPVDFFLRRTNLMLFRRDEVTPMIDPVLDIMGEYLEWSEADKQKYRQDLEETLAKNDLVELKD